MEPLLLFALLCALAPWLVARLHPLLSGVTRPMVYLLVAAQVSIVPVLVALDPQLDFGSDTYSLGAGIGIALILYVEMFFVAGSMVGLLAGMSYIGRRERKAAEARAAEMLALLEAGERPDL